MISETSTTRISGYSIKPRRATAPPRNSKIAEDLRTTELAATRPVVAHPESSQPEQQILDHGRRRRQMLLIPLHHRILALTETLNSLLRYPVYQYKRARSRRELRLCLSNGEPPKEIGTTHAPWHSTKCARHAHH